MGTGSSSGSSFQPRDTPPLSYNSVDELRKVVDKIDLNPPLIDTPLPPAPTDPTGRYYVG